MQLGSRHGQDDLLKFKPSIRMEERGKEGDLKDFAVGRVVDARQVSASDGNKCAVYSFTTHL